MKPRGTLLLVPLAVACGSGTRTSAVQAPTGGPGPSVGPTAAPTVPCFPAPRTEAPARDAALAHEPCPPEAQLVTVSARLSRAVTTCDSNTSDLTFTGPESQARLACSLAVRNAYSAVAVSGNSRVAVAVLRPCDTQPLSEHVPTAAVELVARRTSRGNAFSAMAAGVDPSCVDAFVQTAEADTDITPFDDLASCQAARGVLEERERKDQEAAKRGGLAFLDRETKNQEEQKESTLAALADFDARKKQEVLSAVDRQFAAIERNRFVRELEMTERMLAVLRSRRADEERRPPDWRTVFACVPTRSPS